MITVSLKRDRHLWVQQVEPKLSLHSVHTEAVFFNPETWWTDWDERPVRRRRIQQSLAEITNPESRETFRATLETIFRLLELGQNWDGEGSIAPTMGAVVNAWVWVTALYNSLPSLYGRWIPPLVSDSADGGVMLEWWNPDNRHKLTVYIWEDRTEYVKVWGPDMLNEMDEGSAEPLALFGQIWSWLTR